MLKIKILSVNYKILMFALLISINSSYADELNKNINGKFEICFQDVPIFLVLFEALLVIVRRATGPDFDKVFEVPEII